MVVESSLYGGYDCLYYFVGSLNGDQFIYFQF